jgi:hypothetical protein
MMNATREKTRLWLLTLVGVVATLLGQTHAREIFAPSPHVSGVFAAQTQASTGENYDGIQYDALDSLLAAKGAVGVGDEAFHYTAARWGDVIKKEGLRPGSYGTPTGNLSPLQAKLELALNPTKAAPEIKIRIDLDGLRKAGYEIPKPSRVSSTVTDPLTGRVYQMPGGGYEMQFPYEIPGEFLQVLPIK